MLQLEKRSPGRGGTVPASRPGHMARLPAPSSPAPAHGGHLPVNDRCGLHNSLCLVQKLVSGADGQQGPEPPAGPHDAVPRALVPQLLRPGCLVPGDELRLEDSAEAFGQAVVARRGRVISTFLARVGRWLGVAVWTRLRGSKRLLTSGEGQRQLRGRRLRAALLLPPAPGRGACLRSTNKSEKALELCSHHTHQRQGLHPNSWPAAAGLPGSRHVGETSGREPETQTVRGSSGGCTQSPGPRMTACSRTTDMTLAQPALLCSSGDAGLHEGDRGRHRPEAPATSVITMSSIFLKYIF